MPRRCTVDRQKVVEIASGLFHEHGYRGTTFRVLSEATGVPKGHFYNHFRRKQDLVVAVMAYREERLRRQIDATWEEPHPIKRLERFEALSRESPDGLRGHGCPHATMVIDIARENPELLPTVVSPLELLLQWFEQEYARNGRDKEAVELAQALLAKIQGWLATATLLEHEDSF